MRKYRYDTGFATGTIAVGGTLGILIPPSVILVVYAITTEQNIAKLFQAALVPGLLAAFFYCVVIAIVVRRNPRLAPKTEAIAAEPAPQPPWPKFLGMALVAAIAIQMYRGSLGTGFGAVLASWRDAGNGDGAFVIGGADGLAPALRDKTSLRLAFGALTGPHQFVRIRLLGQLYRATTILAGHPYHRG